mgnify:CR=1 FL=1
MTHLLFVCLGNICRSPTAEAVFLHEAQRLGLSGSFSVDSAGTIAAHAGERADARMRRHAAERGYDLQSISRKVTAADFERFDVIYAMDRQNLQDLQAMAPDAVGRAKVKLFLEGVPGLRTDEVPDPYYGGPAGFEEVLDLLEAACQHHLGQRG